MRESRRRKLCSSALWLRLEGEEEGESQWRHLSAPECSPAAMVDASRTRTARAQGGARWRRRSAAVCSGEEERGRKKKGKKEKERRRKKSKDHICKPPINCRILSVKNQSPLSVWQVKPGSAKPPNTRRGAKVERYKS